MGRAIYVAHEGHHGMAKTKSFLRSKVWFPGIDARVEKVVKDCPSCQLLTPEPKTIEPLRMSELPGNSWKNISIDFYGPLPNGDYLFLIVN